MINECDKCDVVWYNWLIESNAIDGKLENFLCLLYLETANSKESFKKFKVKEEKLILVFVEAIRKWTSKQIMNGHLNVQNYNKKKAVFNAGSDKRQYCIEQPFLFRLRLSHSFETFWNIGQENSLAY